MNAWDVNSSHVSQQSQHKGRRKAAALVLEEHPGGSEALAEVDAYACSAFSPPAGEEQRKHSGRVDGNGLS